MKTKVTSLLLFALLLSSCLNSTLRKANKEYNSLRYHDAIGHYEKYLKKKQDAQVLVNLANSYRETNNYKAAEATYAKAVNYENIPSITYFYYGKILMNNGNYNEARTWFKKYLSIQQGDIVASMLLASCNTVMDRYRDTTLYEVQQVNIPSFTSAFSVTEYQDGVVFSGDKKVFSGKKENPWTGNSYLDLYQMKKDANGQWMKPEVLKGDINGPYHEGPAAFTKDEKTVYFSRSNYYKKKMNVNEVNENNLKIFKAEKVGEEWKKLEELPFNSDDYSCGHPALSNDEKQLYFVSDMPGGLGGTDIYVSTFDGKSWSKPENLGAPINTPGNEMFPYVHSDGSFYFSSDGHNSMGGLDVFVTYKNESRWMQPENLNYPLNSTKDDFGFSLGKDNTHGFISSSRKDKDEVYEFTKKAPHFNLFGTARKKGTDIPVEGVTVEIIDDNNKVIAVKSGKDGKFKIALEWQRNYFIACTKFGCFTRTDQISTKDKKYSEDFYADFEVEEIVINKPIVLENIYYDFDKWIIREDAAKELDRLAKLLKDNPKIQIELGSHTDARGTDMYNLVLSDKRAKAAVDFLISRGIDPSRLTWKGYGETQLRNKCSNGVKCSEEEHQLNRRTEFKVIKIE